MMTATRRPQILYLTTSDVLRSANTLSRATRIAIGVLARDISVSLAVAGPVDHSEIQKLREDFASIRAAGGFPASSADQHSEPALRRLLRKRCGDDVINARLQAAIQRRSGDYDAVVVDDLTAWPYRPVQQNLPVYFLAHQAEMDDAMLAGWGWLPWRNRTSEAAYQRSALAAVTAIYARPEVASTLLSQGLSLSRVNPAFGGFRPEIQMAAPTEWSDTASRVGYVGYLGDDRNLASLEWLLREVWAPSKQALRGAELHLVGAAPPSPLRELAAAHNNVYLHSGGRQQLQLLGCRAVIEPLMFEDHVDSKLVNAMAHGLPVITTQQGLSRAHTQLGAAVMAAGSPEQCALAVHRVLTDRETWHTYATASQRMAGELLVEFEVAHSLRRALLN